MVQMSLAYNTGEKILSLLEYIISKSPGYRNLLRKKSKKSVILFYMNLGLKSFTCQILVFNEILKEIMYTYTFCLLLESGRLKQLFDDNMLTYKDVNCFNV